ncbi:RsiV family protein [Aquimarina pacifica]|uniref:RsiV family protein n=1 Tax=Aquimarina pacifica TaxID=1296415 RepID=UPI000472612C|nr:RsiV family protein [Aquimarina pacifica]
MKTLLYIILPLFLYNCKNQPLQENTPNQTNESSTIQSNKSIIDTIALLDEEPIEFTKEKINPLKKQKLIKLSDDKEQLSTLVIEEKLYKKNDFYILDYKYPRLNEGLDTDYASFNTFFTENYLNIEVTENEILDDKFIYCDSAGVSRCMDKRIIDYKIYAANERLISVLLYKENYYSGMKHSTYMFECLNYDLTDYNFKYFGDFFINNAEKKVFNIINKIITAQIYSGELYMDCWEIAEEDFRVYKNNFVINDTNLEYYFDDCIICPSYTGTYSISIPITDVMHLLKKYNAPQKLL